MAENQHTSLKYGAEFRPLAQLRKIFRFHLLFSFFTDLYERGMEYVYTRDLSESKRMVKLRQQIERGNHNSATSKPKELLEKVYRDVKYGFALPVLASIVEKLPGAMVQPCGLHAQFSLTRSGDRVLKDRLTHNLSYSISQYDASVNKRIDHDAYPPLVHG